ncbi:MAG: hypothetical protein IJK92_03945 [Bacteroidales bacterium]|nr:hypothetical protein [Bacteroidales bacterium]
MYNKELEELIDAALEDGVLTEKEKQVLFKRAQSMGIDLDEFEMVLDARLVKLQKEEKAKVQVSAPKSDKYGDIKKCPSCGAMVESFTTRCPDCGYEFRNVDANVSIQKLFELLNEVEDKATEGNESVLGGLVRKSFGIHNNKDMRKRKAIIQNFPIPNTKEDILEFLSQALPLAKGPGFFRKLSYRLGLQNGDSYAVEVEMSPVWKRKCEQIIMKAKFSMKDDKNTLAEIMEYAKELKIKV